MENMNKAGIFFGADSIRLIVEHYMDWAEIAEDQTFCAENILDPKTPVGASIIVGIDGITCEGGTNELKLVLSSGLYELSVYTVEKNEKVNIRFGTTIHVQGTYGRMVNGELDILTEEEKDFKETVESRLNGRTDEYAMRFLEDNKREVGGRGLILLEKMKAEIAENPILYHNNVEPIQLINVFIELTEQYLNTCQKQDELKDKRENLVDRYDAMEIKGGRKAKKIYNNIVITDQNIKFDKEISEFCLKAINKVVCPVLDMSLSN